jgi:hypothetical protein
MSAESPVAAKHLAWSYSRTSTVRQAREDRSGMERQQEALAAWLRDHPEYQLQDQLIDPGVSASTGANRKRGALGRFIAAAEAGQVPPGSVLIVESLTRFSREEELDVVETLMSSFWGRGLGLAVCAHNCIYSKELMRAEPHRMHMLWGSLSQARAEADERARRSQGGARKRERLQEAGEKEAAATPWWIQRDPETRKLRRDGAGNFLIDPIAQATINRAIELAIGGMGTTLIARTLNDEKRPLPQTSGRRNQYSDKAGDAWTHGRVSYLLRHPALLGDLVRRDGRTIAGFYPPAIAVEQWHQLRESVAARDKLRGSLRGGGQKMHNVFMGLSRCGDCGGPMSFHASGERARIDHPGYLACREANRRESPNCGNSGYLNYADAEAHLLTRLAAPIWHELLGNPEQDQEVDELQREVDALAHEQRSLETRLATAEERFQDLWVSGASDLKQELAERAVADMRQQLAVVKANHGKRSTDLQLLLAKPSGAEAAAEMRRQVVEFWQRLRAGDMEPTERRLFNRWLRCRQPSIEFRFHPAGPDGQQQIELVVGGESVNTMSLAPIGRRMALQEGLIDPTVRENPDGTALVIDWEGGRGISTEEFDS